MAGDPEDPQEGHGVFHLGELRLGESPPGSAGEPPVTHRSRRWIIMVAVFLVGAMVGSYAWLARSDMLESAAVDLIVTEVRHDSPLSDGTLHRVVVYVRNLGEEEVTVTNAWLPSRAGDDDRDAREAEIPPGEKAAISLDSDLNCGTGLPDVIEAEVQTSAGKTSAQLPVPATNVLHNVGCRSTAGEVWIESARSASGPPVEPAEHVESGLAVIMPLSIRSWSVEEVEVVDVAVSASPGLDAEPSGIVGRHETRTVADLRVEWTVTGCSDRYLGEPIEIEVTFADHPPDTMRVPDAVPQMLLAIADGVCES